MLRFLRPSLWKILLTLTFLTLSSFLWRAYTISRISDTFPHGFPFQFYIGWGPCRPGEVCSEFNSTFLLFDLLIWYVVSALLTGRIQKRT